MSKPVSLNQSDGGNRTRRCADGERLAGVRGCQHLLAAAVALMSPPHPAAALAQLRMVELRSEVALCCCFVLYSRVLTRLTRSGSLAVSMGAVHETEQTGGTRCQCHVSARPGFRGRTIMVR